MKQNISRYVNLGQFCQDSMCVHTVQQDKIQDKLTLVGTSLLVFDPCSRCIYTQLLPVPLGLGTDH